jgi:hypothetical protein
MSKPLIMLILTVALGFAQTQPDPADETRKTARQKGYHETVPKNTGPTPKDSKAKPAKDKKINDALDARKPPTREPELAPPNKP